MLRSSIFSCGEYGVGVILPQTNNNIMGRNSNNSFHKRNNGGLGFALFLILFGGVYLLINIGVIDILYKPILISWPMLLIVIGLWSLLKRQYAASIILLVLGLLFIFPKLNAAFPEVFMVFEFDFKTYWPLILVFIGTVLIISRFLPHRKNRSETYNTDSRHNIGSSSANDTTADYIEKNLLFSSQEQIVLTPNFRGGEANVMFGELIIDLRRATQAEGTHQLNLSAIFGNIVVYVPADWNIELRTNTILASFEDKRYPNEIKKEYTSKLIIKGSTIFAGAEIRN